MDKITMYIPSKNRHMSKPTLSMIEYLKKTTKINWIFVISESDENNYRKILDDENLMILPDEIANRGVPHLRKHIYLTTKERKFFFVDDDIYEIRSRRELVEIPGKLPYHRYLVHDNWDDIVDEFSRFNDYVTLGLFAKQNGWRFFDDIVENVRLYAFIYWNLDVFSKEDEEKFRDGLKRFNTLEHKLYYDNYINALVLSLGYKIANLNKFNICTPVNASDKQEGGLSEVYARIENQSKAAEHVRSFFPHHSSVKIKRGKNWERVEIAIKWKKLYKDTIEKNSKISLSSYF